MNLKNKKLGLVATTMVATLLISGSAATVNNITQDSPSLNVTVAEQKANANQVDKAIFQDVKGDSAESLAINKLAKEGYIKSENANFLPSQIMTTQYLAKLIVDTGLVKGDVVPVDSTNLFASNVQTLIDGGILPASLDVKDEATIAKKVTQGALSDVFAKMFGLKGENPLVANGIVKESAYNPSKEVTRGDFALQLSQLLALQDGKAPTVVQKESKSAVKVASATPIAKAVTKAFSDVSKNSPYYATIHEMRDMGIIHGYADNTFKPNEPINRQNGAALLTRFTPMNYKGTAKFPKLSDVTSKNANYTVLLDFQKLGIYNVKSDGKVYPSLAMTRGEMAKSIAIAFELPVKATTKSSFKDVKASNEYSPYIEALAKAGITSGYEDGTFKPSTSLSRAHFAVFMHRAINKVGKPVHEKPNTDTGTTKPPVVDTKPVKPPVVEKPVTPPVKENPSKGDYSKPTAYQGDFEYTSDGRVKFEDKKLEDFPLYAYPDHKNDKMYFEGKTNKEYNAMNEKILIDRKGDIGVTANAKYSLWYENGKLKESTAKGLTTMLGKYGMSEGEIYRMITYLFYTGDVYKTNNLTAYIVYAVDNGMPSVAISYGKI